MIKTVLSVILLFPPLTYAESDNQCKINESTLFTCATTSKVASICASKDMSENSGYIRYIFGSSEKVELEYPQDKGLAKNNFKWYNAWSPGVISFLEFGIGKYSYYIYSSQGNNYSEPGNPDSIKFYESNGIAIYKENSLIKNIKCLDSDRGISESEIIKKIKSANIPLGNPEPLFNEDIPF